MGFNVGEGETRRVVDEMIVEYASISEVTFEMGVEDGDCVLIGCEGFVKAGD